MAVRWKEGYAPVLSDDGTGSILQALAKAITNDGTDSNWTMVYPENVTDVLDIFAIKHTVGINTVFIEFHRPKKVKVNEVEKDNYYFVEVKFGTKYTAPIEHEIEGTWEEDCDSVRARFSWFKSSTEANIKSWLPVQYWVSVTEESVSIVLEGDPSANFNDRLISFGYFGSVKPFDEDVGTNPNWNFGVTFSSDISPFDYLTEEELNRYSDNTATGVVDINMLKTYTGFPMQAHYASFTTPDEFVNKKLEGPSAYTKKYHMTPVYVFHGFDGYRGELQNVVATDRSTVVNLDEMVHKYNPTDCNADPTDQDVYKVFLLNAPQSIFNNSTNVLYAIGILKSTGKIVSGS